MSHLKISLSTLVLGFMFRKISRTSLGLEKAGLDSLPRRVRARVGGGGVKVGRSYGVLCGLGLLGGPLILWRVREVPLIPGRELSLCEAWRGLTGIGLYTLSLSFVFIFISIYLLNCFLGVCSTY